MPYLYVYRDLPVKEVQIFTGREVRYLMFEQMTEAVVYLVTSKFSDVQKMPTFCCFFFERLVLFLKRISEFLTSKEVEADLRGRLLVRLKSHSESSDQSELRKPSNDLKCVCRRLTLMHQSEISCQVQKLKSPIKE